MKKVEDVKRPLKKGERFLVPCLVRIEVEEILDEQELWMDLTTSFKKKKLYVCPVINHPHNDMENGQKETHYHLDYRFIKHNNKGDFPRPKKTHSNHFFGDKIRPTNNYGKLYYFELPVINEYFSGITPVKLIEKSKLKHKCIHKGKCPHRGYELSQVKPINGKITCPLHGLEFDEKTKTILNQN